MRALRSHNYAMWFNEKVNYAEEIGRLSLAASQPTNREQLPNKYFRAICLPA